MKPVESKDVEDLVNLNSILILDVDCWVASYLRNVVARSPTHITTKQGNKTLPAELWLDILERVEFYIDENTYKPVYPIEMTPRAANGSGTEPTMICNVLKDWKSCGKLKFGSKVVVYEKCLRDPSYKMDPEKDDVDDEVEPYFSITKTIQDDALSIPMSHLSFDAGFLFRKIEISDMIAQFEDGDCWLCRGDRDCDIVLDWIREDTSFFCVSVLGHRECNHGVVCPLCIGEEYADEDLEVNCKSGGYYWDNDEEEEDTEEEKMAKKEFQKRLRQRYRELGYRWW
ncbi:hypothetical protein IL306_012617 [Fusarium sp. DS 682]|nr:hypothetical protein IL306_012617 [Fusarium sp. DS 682]